MSFTVPENVTKVYIYVAGYKAKTSKITINGGDPITLTTSTDDGEYVSIEVDTSVNKTVTFATEESAARCAIDKIVFYSTNEHEHKGGEADCLNKAVCLCRTLNKNDRHQLQIAVSVVLLKLILM
jgi:hypothetical protein